MIEITELRKTFTREVEGYHKYRPQYPAILFDYLVQTTALVPKSQLLEIGPGTGQATVPLAERGYEITAVELGEEMADKARATLGKFPNVQVMTAAFEDANVPEHHFDLIYSATAFHWIDPAVRFAKSHRLLRDQGHLAIIHMNHVSDEQGDAFFHDTSPLYQAFMTADSPHKFSQTSLPLASSLRPLPVDTALFKPKDFARFACAQTYNTAEYIGLLSTYSPHIAMPEDRRQAFLAGIADLIDTKYGGRVTKHYVATLALAQALPASSVL